MPSPYSSQPNETDGFDSYITSDNVGTNYSTDNKLGVGERNDAASNNRTLIKFDLSSIPATATIQTAVLSLWVFADLSSNARDFKIYRLLRNWTEAGVTWNKYDGTNNWTTAGAGSDGNDADLSTVLSTVNMGSAVAVGTQVDFTFNATGLTELTKIISGIYSNYGFLIRADTETNDCYYFNSSSFATAGQRPRLVITYSEGGQVITWSSS